MRALTKILEETRVLQIRNGVTTREALALALAQQRRLRHMPGTANEGDGAQPLQIQLSAASRLDAAAGPNPIPGGTPLLGGAFHLFIPADGDPIDAEPATITDFKGYVGNAYLFGTVSRKNKVTGEEVTLPFVDSDMRFMQGIYLGTDQQIHQGTFGFI